ncbi:menaquinone-specific isochorismate synthase [Bacillus sp. OxB-1]|uniref:isochorismate synthase n=1 Tax=Bacillus sp. (strain OxB-1) TaxID=98228 RepID=UPI0005822BC8|nr:isochorismate synthase [Bacillus sp. OxB-1]BAQ08485.1 menaquinone-specific isochorismate synthase [Bacillus sp. OxB-1]
MNRKLTATRGAKNGVGQKDIRFFTETIDVGRISPLAFFEAGDSCYKNERFFWQNANKTLTLVGIGHATVLTTDHGEDRFTSISNSWKQLREALIKEEKDMEPVLFGGFSFDPVVEGKEEWKGFPSSFFVVPSFQLKIQDGKTMIAINLVTDRASSAEEFEKLREERDRLLHIAQVEEFPEVPKPQVLAIEEREKEGYLAAVEQATERIREGEADKVVIARSIDLRFQDPIPSISALHHITNEQQESYQFGLQMDDRLFFGATPERLIRIENGKAFSACVAGSTRRGKSAVEDRLLGEELLGDRKNREEHQYVVHMISEVFQTLCGSVSVPKMPRLMKIRDIQHLFTPVVGELEEGTDIFDLVRALHPTPALGGSPTDVAMEMIRELEKMDRGYYAAPIGWTDTAGNGEFAVAIRSGLLDGKRAHLYAGGGIVANSEKDMEYEETWVKFRPVLRALGGKLNG